MLQIRRSAFSIVLLALAQTSFATNYEITSTIDADENDGFCTLREALHAITHEEPRNECEAGTGNNTIELLPGEVYQLGAAGELVLGGGERDVVIGQDEFRKDIIVQQPITGTTTIKARADDAFDDDIKENPQIIAAADERVLVLQGGMELNLSNVTLSGGDVSSGSGGDLVVAGRGGLVYVRDSKLQIQRRAVLENGSAQDGGAIYIEGGIVSIEDALITGNSATTGNGGAINGDAADVNLVTAYQTTFTANTADAGAGGALYLDGTAASAQFENTTFYANSGGSAGTLASVIHIASDNRNFNFNNVTVAGNDGPGPALFAVDQAAPPASDSEASDLLLNSVIVGNTGGDCDGPGLVDDSDARIDFTLLQSTNCPVDSRLLPDNGSEPGTIPNSATFAHLVGDVGVCPNGLGSAACTPITFDNDQQGFLPNGLATAPVILNAGPSESSAVGACFPSDQREASRQDRCDPGAIEFDIASGVEDEFEVVSGVTSGPLDVLENDIGDTTVDCTALVPGPLPVIGAVPGDASVDACIQVVQFPLRGNLRIDIDALGAPVFRYRSSAGFQGIDSFVYRVPDAAFTGPTRGDLGVSAPVFLVVDPASGLTEYDSIGGAAGTVLLAMLLAAFRGGRSRVLLIICLLFAPLWTSAATITVNSLADNIPTIVGDNLCTLREALNNAIDNTPVFSPDCRTGATGRDLIILPEGTITVAAPLEVRLSAVEIVGAAPDLTFIDGGGVSRIFDASDLLELRSLTLQGGSTTGNGGAILTSSVLLVQDVRFIGNHADGEGGAIYLAFNVNERNDVEIENTLFRQNDANIGGALSAFAQTQQHDIVIENSTFEENEAAVEGSAVSFGLGQGAVYFVNSTFTGNNNARLGGSANAVIDLSSAGSASGVAPRISIMNSTFLGNDPLNILELPDVSLNVDVGLFHTVISTSGNDCSTAATPLTLTRAYYTLFDFDPVGTACEANDSSNVATDANIVPALNGGTLVVEEIYYEEGVTEGQMYVPHFPIIDPAYVPIVDAGNPEKQEKGIQNIFSCRTTDLKGASRLSGIDAGSSEGCDLGAFELQVPTAVEDKGSNERRKDRLVIVDVLANDIAGDNEIDLDSVIVSVAPASGTVTDIEVTPPGDSRCQRVDGIEPEQRACVLLTYELDAPLACNAVSPEPFEDTFRYTFEDTATPTPQVSTEGEVTIQIGNVAPIIESVTVEGRRGENVVFPLRVSDPDGSLLLDSFKLSGEPTFARADDNGTPLDTSDDLILGTGVIVNADAGTVTYVPADRTKAFSDSFSLSVSDDCTSEGSGTFRVVYRDDSGSGGSLLSGGSLSGAALFMLVLLGGRRRRRPLSRR